ncbi:MAG: hypothetical protein QOF46_1872, partial [Paraburkholderia sp.]|nr:hypothetical protein [Paraburkholderia sp.]
KGGVLSPAAEQFIELLCGRKTGQALTNGENRLAQKQKTA